MDHEAASLVSRFDNFHIVCSQVVQIQARLCRQIDPRLHFIEPLLLVKSGRPVQTHNKCGRIHQADFLRIHLNCVMTKEVLRIYTNSKLGIFAA